MEERKKQNKRIETGRDGIALIWNNLNAINYIVSVKFSKKKV